MDFKQPPFSIEAEQAVLGGLMLDNSKYSDISGLLSQDDFYKNEHKTIFRAIEALASKQRSFDPVTVFDLIDSRGLSEEVGGLSYLSDLVSNNSGYNTKSYSDIVKGKSILRDVIKASNKTIDDAYFPGELDSISVLSKAFDRLRLIDTVGDSDIPSIKEVLLNTINQLERRGLLDGKISGLPTGLDHLDDSTNGLQKGELYILAGRPASGKSTCALNIAAYNAIRKSHVVFFSLEMPKERVMDKCFSSIGEILFNSIKKGILTRDDWSAMTSTMVLLQESGLVVDDKADQTIGEIQLKCKKLASKRKLDLIVIDYLQLVRVKNASRFEEVSEVSRQLKAMAKNFDCPVIALSQLNRGLENRNDKRPRLSDLRESGQIEQDADYIAMLYRDEVYNPENNMNKGISELIIEKHRFGETGRIYLKSELQYSRFKTAYDSDTMNYRAFTQTNGGDK